MRLQVRNRPLNRILDALALRLARDPHFEVLWAVVAFHAVLVMHVLKFLQRSAKNVLHHCSVLQYGSAPAASDDVPAFGLNIPAARVSSSFVTANDTQTFVRTAFDAPIVLAQKIFAAVHAFLRDEKATGYRLTLAFSRTVQTAFCVCRFALVLLAAVLASFGNWRRAKDSVISPVNSGWHDDLSKLWTAMVIIPNRNLIASCSGFIT
jgi:hypothetical protein